MEIYIIMAKSEILVPFILSWETDKYTNNKYDRGKATKYVLLVYGLSFIF